jgi:hypothetical protein
MAFGGSGKKIAVIVTVAVLVIGTAVGAILIYMSANSSPVPKSIAKQVNFPVYYPDQKKLPVGYLLSKTSFKSPQPGVVVYAVNYGNGKHLVFSVQRKPSDDELAAFVKNYIPIHRQILTLSGTATIGSINNQTVASLPTDHNTWIIMTGPMSIYATDDLANVLKAITK